jgi:cytochrome P450
MAAAYRARPNGGSGFLFAFSGGSWARPGMGSGLYREEPAFRESWDACCAVAGDEVGGVLLASIRDEAVTRFSTPSAIAAACVLQIAQTDLWLAYGVMPGASLGISGGEVAAAYASGVLSRRDAVRTACAVAGTRPDAVQAPMRFRVAVDSVEAKHLARAAPVPVEFIGAIAPRSCMLLVAAEDAAIAREYLQAATSIERESPAPREYHTPLTTAARHRMVAELAGIDPRPARLPVYLASAGGDAAGDTLGPLFWVWTVSHPFYIDEATRSALEHGWTTMVGLGAEPTMRQWIKAAAGAHGHELRFVTSMLPGRPEPETWREAAATLRRRSAAGAVSHAVHRVWSTLRPPVRRAPERAITVTNYEEARAVLSSPEVFSSKLCGHVDQSVLSLDPPEHVAPRAALRELLSPRETERMALVAEQLAEDLLAPLTGVDEFDLLSELATPLLEGTLGRAVGLEPEQIAAFADAARGSAYVADEPLIEDALATLPEPPSLVTRWAESPGLDGERATRLLRMLWMAGITSARHAIGATALLLGEETELRGRVSRDPELVGPLVEEVVRLQPPGPRLGREAVQQAELGDSTVAAGTRVGISVTAANRDPARFPEPDQVHLDRPARHLSFGAGPHRCPGARLARAETAAAVRTLLRLMPRFEVLQPRSTLRYPPSHRGYLEQLVIAPGGGA